MKLKRWPKVGVTLIIVGAILLTVNAVVYGPRFAAFSEALKTRVSEHTDAPAPNPASFGLDGTAFVVSMVLGTAGEILVFVGAAYLVIYVTAQIAKRLGYAKTDST